MRCSRGRGRATDDKWILEIDQGQLILLTEQLLCVLILIVLCECASIVLFAVEVIVLPFRHVL